MSTTASSPSPPPEGTLNILKTPIEPWKKLVALFTIMGSVIAASNTLVRCGAEQYKAASQSGADEARETVRITGVENRISDSEEVNKMQADIISDLKQADAISLMERETIKRNLTESTKALTETIRLNRDEINHTLDKVSEKLDKIAERVGVPQKQ